MQKPKGKKFNNEWVARGFGSKRLTTVESDATNETLHDPIPYEHTNKRDFVASNKFNKRPQNTDSQPFTNIQNKKKLKILSSHQKELPTTETSGTKSKTGIELGTESEKDTIQKTEQATKPASSKVAGKRNKAKNKSYTLFIGNLSYDTTREDLFAHFYKCGYIKEVRVPLNKEDNSPRGFAYLEVEDNETYEKVLSMHHTFLKRRRINVECTFGGSKDSNKRKALIKQKTLKLRFLSKEGKISAVKKRQWGKPKPEATN